MNPKSKVTANRSFVTTANLRYASPKQTQNLTINVQSASDPNKEIDVKYDNETCPKPPVVENPYKDIKDEDVEKLLLEKDRTIEAMNLIIKQFVKIL